MVNMRKENVKGGEQMRSGQWCGYRRGLTANGRGVRHSHAR